MKSSAMIMALLAVVSVSWHSVQAKCPAVPVKAQGAISGDVQDGDVLFLRFVYSPKRVESSLPRPPQGQMFTVTGAYSTFTRMSPLGGHVCSSVPHLIQLVLQGKDGVVLDTADLNTPDPSNGVVEVNYGNRQTIVLNRRSMPSQ